MIETIWCLPWILLSGGRIDHAHHDGLAALALLDTIALEEAVVKVMELTEEKDTLIVVTADHSHVMTIGGWPVRGNPILGEFQPVKNLLPSGCVIIFCSNV